MDTFAFLCLASTLLQSFQAPKMETLENAADPIFSLKAPQLQFILHWQTERRLEVIESCQSRSLGLSASVV